MKRNIGIVPLVLTVFLANQSTLAFASVEANDISGHWAEKIIIEWQSKNKISGYEDNTFRPDSPISRAEFIHLLNSIISMEQSDFSGFDDVNTNDWFYVDVAKAVSNHIIAGFEDNTFRPNEMITRAQAALIISNALHLTDTSNKISLTDDKDIPEWSKNAVYAMLNVGYLSGYEDGSFGPNKSMTRAEAVSMLDRIEKSIKTFESTNQTANSNDNTNINVAYIDTKQDSLDTEEKASAKMVWENGGRGNSSYASNSKPSEDAKDREDSKNIITINKNNISDFYGQILKDTVVLELEDTPIELINVKFTGNVEVVSKIQSDIIPTVYLKGNTSINNMVISSHVVINSENNRIDTLIIKEETTVSGNTNIKNLQCYAKTNLIDNTNVADIVQIFSTLVADSNTKINTAQLIANTEANFTTNGTVNKIITSEKGNISYIHLGENVNTTIDISSFVTLDNITLSEDAKANIKIQKNGKLKELLSSSKCLGTTVTNYGTVEHIIATNTETITAENAVVNLAKLQSISILSQPHHLHYNQNDTLSLEGLSLLLQYENDITQTINNINDFDLYHIEALPAHNTVLTVEYHNQPIKIYSNNIYTNTNFITLDDMIDTVTKDVINKQPFIDLIEECKTILSQTHIKNTNENTSQEHTNENDSNSFQDIEDNISQQLYYIDKNDFNSFKNTISISEKLLSKKDITQSEIQQQYNILQTALQEFEAKRILQIMVEPIISVSNPSPEYGADDVTFTIDNIDPNLTYYYTLDGSNPTTESEVFTQTVTLVPPEETEETTITIKMIAAQGENLSDIAEKTVTYSAAVPIASIEEIALYNINSPFFGAEPNENVLSQNNEQYNMMSCNWKEKISDSEKEEDTEEIVSDDSKKEEDIAEIVSDIAENKETSDDTKIKFFRPSTTYMLEIHLKAVEPYIFDLESNRFELKGAKVVEEYVSINDSIESVEIDKKHSTINDLHILLTFKPTPELTEEQKRELEEQAEEELKKLTPPTSLLKISIPNSTIEEEDFRNEAILTAAQSVVSKYWIVEFEPSFFKKLEDNLALTVGKFTIISEIDSSIFISNELPLDIKINIE